jgi:TRAP transporter 4TM/12TM fusion protein
MRFWVNLNLAKLSRIIAITMSLYQLYTAYAGVEFPWIHYAIHLTFALNIIFLTPTITGYKRIINVILAGLSVLAVLHIIIQYDQLMDRTWYVTPITAWQYFFMGIWTLVVLESSRRVVGRFFAIVVLLFLTYFLWGRFMPGVLHCEVVTRKFLEEVFLIPSGLFGIPLATSATYIFIFILFGSFLVELGVGKFFQDLALCITGQTRGGPAKVSVIMSGLFGTISGSSVSNVMTTGSFTIPLMKRIGYRPEFAGAVEAAASTGGMIMPPVMAAAAFVMAEFTGIPYIEICKMALIPALLYFLAVGMMVHFEAINLNLSGVPKNELPNLKEVLLSRGYMLVPFIVIITIMIRGFSPTTAGFWGIVSTVVVSVFRKDTRLTIPKLLTALENGAKNSVMVAIACAGAGMIIGVVGITGIGLKLSSMLMLLSGGIKLVALFLCMIISLILGMGLTITASYIMQTCLVIPVLITLGVPKSAAHLFTIYFCAFCGLTPPVAMTSYAAAGLAQSEPMKTSLIAFKLSLAGFIVPFIFAYNQALLLIGPWEDILVRSISSIIAVIAGASSLEGSLIEKTKPFERILLGFSAMMLILPVQFYIDMMGALIFFSVLLIHKKRIRGNILFP